MPDGKKQCSITTVQKAQKKLFAAFDIKKVGVPNAI
jgi:hypothetical protein